MASSSGASGRSVPKDTLCRYFMHGACDKGDTCPFNHSFSAKPDMTCRYYLQGNCSYGSKCRYDHIKPSRSKQSTASSSSTGPSLSTRAAAAASSASLTGAAGTASDIRPAAPSAASQSSSSETRQSTMKTLRKVDKRPLKDRMPSSWADTPAFVPKPPTSPSEGSGDSASSLSYSAAAATAGVEESITLYPDGSADMYAALASDFAADSDGMLPMETYNYIDEVTDEAASVLLCPFAQMGDCQFGEDCVYLHGEMCDICGRLALHPTDGQQRKEHLAECSSHIEKEMEMAFAEQRTQGVACGICLEVVCEKADPADRYFGVLSECKHPFCLSCIRKWRSSKNKKTVIRACPACRAPSYFVTPSKTWVEDGKEKDALIDQYKSVLCTKPCKYFQQGRGECPFSDSCFYRHALPDGSVAPPSKPNIRHRTDEAGVSRALQHTLLSEFLFNERDDDFDDEHLLTLRDILHLFVM